MAGFHCSLPHKVAVVRHLDELAESAALIGAVNWVVIRDGWLIGENTDGQGFLSSLCRVADPTGKHVVVLGAGGAARAIAFELALAGAVSLLVVNQVREGADALVGDLRERMSIPVSGHPWEGTSPVPAKTGILVNATSVGLLPDVGAKLDIDDDTLSPGLVVADVIPNPPRTAPRRGRDPWLHCDRRARDAGGPGSDRDPPVDRARR